MSPSSWLILIFLNLPGEDEEDLASRDVDGFDKRALFAGRAAAWAAVVEVEEVDAAEFAFEIGFVAIASILGFLAWGVSVSLPLSPPVASDLFDDECASVEDEVFLDGQALFG